MTNKDLFKQAIAEAKTIREAAITNAKEALEESLTPHLKEMLAQKLQEMEEEDNMEEIVNEEDLINDPKGETAHGNVAEAEEEEEAEEAEGEEEVEGEEEEELEIEDMTIDDLKDLIKDIIAQETGHEEELPGEEAPEGMEDMVGSEEEEIDINELLAELAEMDEEKEMVDENIDIIAQLIDMFPFLNNNTAEMLLGVFGAMGLTGAAAIMAKVQDLALKGKFGEKAKAFAEKLQKSGKDAFNVTQQRESIEEEVTEEEVNEEVLNESLVGQVADLLGIASTQAEFILGAIGAMGLTGASAIMAKVHELALKGKFGEKAKAKAEALGKAGTAAARVTQQRESAELEEALATVAELRTQLQEVNLLNAKLLYVNKVFKANNLSEGQKVNVIAAFDKAETVREVKLVFETVSKNVVAKKPTTIKEHTFASKATGTTATPQKEVINEVSEQVLRMQKLAGIIK